MEHKFQIFQTKTQEFTEDATHCLQTLDKSFVDENHLLIKLDCNNVLYFGETHHITKVLEAQLFLLVKIAEYSRSVDKPCYLVLGISYSRQYKSPEHFNILQQELLDKYQRSEITIEELDSEYSKSLEGFSVSHYRYLLGTQKTNSTSDVRYRQRSGCSCGCRFRSSRNRQSVPQLR